MSYPVLSDEALQILAKTSPIDDSEPGWLRVRAASLPGRRSVSEDTIVRIPRDIDSKETVELIGFTKSKASAIFERYLAALPKFSHMATIRDFFRGQVYSYRDVSSDDDDEWSRLILRMGITSTVKDQILDPEFRTIRLSKTAHFWVLETVTTIYEWLDNLDSLILSSIPRSSALGTLNRVIAEDEIDLLKGGSETRPVEGFCNQRFQPAYETRLHVITSRPGADFSPGTCDLYLTDNREFALQDALYARRRMAQGESSCEAGILHVIVKQGFLRDAEEIYGDVWRQIVMYGRLMCYFPDHLESYKRASILIGPVLMANTNQVSGVVGRGLDYRGLQPHRLSDGLCATQYCFKEVDRSDLKKYVRMWWEPIFESLGQ